MRLSLLLLGVERLIEHAARLDAFAIQPPRTPYLVAFEARVDRLDLRIDQALDRLTVDRLTHDLAWKQAQDRKRPSPQGPS